MALLGRTCRATAMASASLLVGACANATAPALPSLPEIAAALSLNDDEVVGSPTEVYSRLARGALSCWFGAKGALKANYIYHAEAEPASKGGKSEIVVHERDRTSENPKGLRVFRVVVEPKGKSASVAVENLQLPAPLAQSMDADVRRWAAGAIGCAKGGPDWSPQAPAPHDDPDTWNMRTRKGRAT